MGAGSEVELSQESLEQQQALALARARMRMKQAMAPAEEGGGVGRQVGLTARNIGPQAAGAMAGGAMGSVIPGVGTALGAGMGALAATVIQAADQLGGTNYLEQIMDRIGLPKEATDEEKLAGAGVRAMAGMGAMGGAARGAVEAGKQLFRAPGQVAETLAASPGLGAVSAASGGVAQEAVRQNPPGIIPPELGGNATEQFLANMAASAVAPAGVAAGRTVGNAVKGVVGDVAHAVGASFGRKGSIERLTRDAVKGLTEENAPAIREALANSTTYVQGAKPTVAEALAEANMKRPSDQIGGGLVRLQDKISGHPGVEDVLPSKMKANQAALDTHMEGVRRQTAPLRERAFENARLYQGVSPQSIRWDLTIKEMDPAVRGHPLAVRLLQDVRRHVNKVVDDNGKIDPEVLYSVRQTASSRLKKMQQENPYSDKAVGQKALRAVQQSIDKAMEDGGAVGWRSYLKQFEEGMKPVNQHMERLGAASDIAQVVQGVSPEALVKETLPQIPTLLHRPTMFVNFVLKLIAKDASQPVMRELATRMQDPQEFLALMSRPAAAPAKKAANDVLMHAAILSNLIQRHQAEQASPPAQ